MEQEETVEQSIRRQAAEQARSAAGAWLHDQMVIIRRDHIENLTMLINVLHNRCIARMKAEIEKGYAQSSMVTQELMRECNNSSREVYSLIDQIADIRGEQMTREGIKAAFGMFDDARKQAVVISDRNMRDRVRTARMNAAEIERQVTERLSR